MQIVKTSLVILITLFAGCSSPPEKPEKPEAIAVEKIVKTNISVSADVNPDIDSRPSPIVVRVFNLKSLGKYKELDFYDLFENYESVLGADLLGAEQLHLKPGEIGILKLGITTKTKYVAVIAAYRDINQAIWRDSIVISEKKVKKLLILVDRLKISIWKK